MGIVVFWLEDGQARFERFASGDLAPALARCEALRRSALAGAPVSHVCIASESPDDRTKAGVAAAPAGYDWTKRRGGRRPAPGRQGG